MSDHTWRRVRIGSVGESRIAWAAGRDVTLPASMLRSAPSGSEHEFDPGSSAAVPAPALAAELRLRAAFTDAPPQSSRLPFNYQRVPPQLRWYIARFMGRRMRSRQAEWAAFPGWPLDLSADFLSDWSSDTVQPVTAPAPAMLTHDIDSPEGLRNLVDRFLPIEEAHGARSTNYIVPCGWPLDHGLLREVVARGHEIGVHGYDHANRTPFLDQAERRRRLAEGKTALERYEPLGYRAPSLLRTAALLDDLADFFLYDSSVPTSGGPFPVFNNGCASARPFRIGRTVELPVSMPRDGTALFLGHSPEEIAELWITTATAIASARGIVMSLTHCEERFSGSGPMLATYRRFVEFIGASPQFVWSTPRAIATATLGES
jgi:hypothetical protein